MNTRPLAALIAAGVLAFPFALLAQDAKTPPVRKPAASAVKKSAPAAAKPAEPLELAHALDESTAAALQKLVDAFNESGRSSRSIVLTARSWKEGTLPAMLVLDAAGRAEFLEGKPRFMPLTEVMAKGKEKFASARMPAPMPPWLNDGKGRLGALPIGLATPVMFFNKEAFKRVGLDPDLPPGHWLTLQSALGQLRDAGYACPYTSARPALIHVENMSTWHNEPFARKLAGKKGPNPGEQLAFNGLVQVKHLALMSSWYKSRYLHIFGRGDEAVPMFSGGQCQVLTAMSSSWPAIKRDARFEVGVAPLPFHDDIYNARTGHTLADGASLWISAGRSASEAQTIARFVTFVLDPERQAQWALDTGFAPLNRAGMVALSPVDAPTVDGVVRVALRQLAGRGGTSAPDTASSVAGSNPRVMQALDEELEALWGDRKPAKAALDTAVQRGAPCATANSLSC